MTDSSLPSYAAVRAGTSQYIDDLGLPPSYARLQAYTIGQHRTRVLLVRPEYLNGHLSLLHAFYGLKREVEDGSDSRFPEVARQMDAECRWSWFVSLAVERFERWCLAQDDADIQSASERLPPLDVIMVWHAYLLNPTWYAEDTLRIPTLRNLGAFGDAFIHLLMDLSSLITSEPSPVRVELWESRTQTSFHLLDACASLTHKIVTCPKCTRSVKASFISTDGSGYSQRNFRIRCSDHCNFEVTKMSLGAHKFVKNLVNDKTPGAYLAATLHTSTNASNTTRASALKKIILDALIQPSSKGLRGRDLEHLILRNLKYSLLDLRANTATLKTQDTLIRRMLSAYGDDRVFSPDLVGAVLRQGFFIQKLHDMRWTQPSYFVDAASAAILQHCVVRYHGFLDLMTQSVGMLLVPTLDVDLAWHTHQLMGKQYQADCLKYVGHYVDHDDKVEEDHLATAFDNTCRAWKSHFGLPYTYCGCPSPEVTFSNKLKIFFTGRPEHDSGFLIPPPTLNMHSATHPSDHNAVFVLNNATKGEQARKVRLRVALERHQKAGASTSRATEHQSAFMHPVPVFSHGPNGCVATSGVVIDSGVIGSCATGIY